MPIVLPDKPVKKTRVNPKIAIFYGAPKVGKTGKSTELPNALILAGEDGAEMYDCMRLSFNSIKELNDIASAIEAKCEENLRAGKKGMDIYPYKFLVIDTIDRLEEMAVYSATVKYKKSTIGKTFEGKSVLELPKGAGYWWLREEVKDNINRLAYCCVYLIIISHTVDTNIDKEGIMVSHKDISLTGKLAQIVSSMADAIGYMYRTKSGGPLMVNFETLESGTMGSRCAHLAGKKMEFDWNKIYLPEGDLVTDEQLVEAQKKVKLPELPKDTPVVS